MTHKDEFDALLHEALSEYRDAEALAGLESRVLGRLASQREIKKKLWLRWGSVAACTAALVLVIWIATKTRSPRTETAAREVTASPSETLRPQAPVPPPEASSATKTRAPGRRETSPYARDPALAAVAPGYAYGPKPEQFPAPAPLIEQEQAFMAALNRHPEALRTPPDSDLAVAIAEIEIEPLSITNDLGED